MKIIFLVQPWQILSILHPTSLANLVVEVGTRHNHQMLLQQGPEIYWNRNIMSITVIIGSIEVGQMHSFRCCPLYMMSSYGNIFHIAGPLRGESTGHRWIPLTKASDAELWCTLWSAPEQTFEQSMEMLLIWDVIALIMMSL